MFGRHLGQSALTTGRDGTDGTGGLNTFPVDRTGQRGFQSVRGTGQIHLGASLAAAFGQRAFCVLRQLLASPRHAEQFCALAQLARTIHQTPVDQDVRNAGLAVDPFGHRKIGGVDRSGIHNEIRLQRDQFFQGNRTAPPGESPQHR